jgi:molybdate transport system substrate-binding protein
MPLAARTLTALALGFFLIGASAADIKVLSTPTVKSVLDDITTGYERTFGHHVNVVYDPVGALKRRLDAGERCDVAILVPNTMDDAAKAGEMDASSVKTIARAGYGVAVAERAKKPDVATVEAVRKTLQDAKSISYSKDSNSSAYFLSLLDKLGLPEVRSRLVAVSGPTVVHAVATGDAELTVITVPNIVSEPGVQLAGRLPAELQSYSVFVAGKCASTANAAAAQSFIDFLQNASVTASMASHGLERVP